MEGESDLPPPPRVSSSTVELAETPPSSQSNGHIYIYRNSSNFANFHSHKNQQNKCVCVFVVHQHLIDAFSEMEV